MPLTGIYGSGGSGKTIIVMYLLNQMPTIKKYGNFNTKLPNWKKIDSISLFELPETNDRICCAWDEAYTELDNRLSMTDENRINSYLIFQARKNNMSMVSISQLNILDCRWRGLERYAIYCKDRPLYDKRGNDCKDDFHYVLLTGQKAVPFTLKYKTALKLFPLYNTKDKILPKDFEQLKARIRCKNPKERNRVVDQIVQEIIKKCNVPEESRAITHDWLKNAMMDLEKDFELEPFIYVRLKNLAVVRSNDSQ